MPIMGIWPFHPQDFHLKYIILPKEQHFPILRMSNPWDRNLDILRICQSCWFTNPVGMRRNMHHYGNKFTPFLYLSTFIFVRDFYIWKDFYISFTKHLYPWKENCNTPSEWLEICILLIWVTSNLFCQYII